jgi:protein-L-isoaspartate(D-aspartate) O-methyltransferase
MPATTNAALCDILKSDNLIPSPAIERAFRAIDRGTFLTNSNYAYDNRPVKEGLLHLSAPYIYARAIEELELVARKRSADKGITVLNVGSGTGYFSSLIAHVLGRTGSVHGVEVNLRLVEHANKQVAALELQGMADIQFVCGNCFQLCPAERQYDRVYVGAGAKNSMLPFMLELLAPGGILVGPFDGKLLKIVKVRPLDSAGIARRMNRRRRPETDRPVALNLSVSGAQYHTTTLSHVSFSPLQSSVPAKNRGKDSGIRFSERVWSPDGHQKFPDRFREAVNTVLMTSLRLYECYDEDSNSVLVEVGTENAAASKQCSALTSKATPHRTKLPPLPSVIWVEIMSYMGRDWFRGVPKSPHSLHALVRCRGPLQTLLRGVKFTLKRSIGKSTSHDGCSDGNTPRTPSRRGRERRVSGLRRDQLINMLSWCK